MTYTVRYAHLEKLPSFNIGDLIHTDDIIGRMGNTGQSDGAHLHIDTIENYVSELWHLSEVGHESEYKYTPSLTQLNYFIDHALFHSEYKITTFFGDPRYKETYGKSHLGYDLYPTEGYTFWDIHWNRSKIGHVLATGYAESSYGNYVLIGWEA